MLLPETVLQFGAGRFLRAFFDRFVQEANEAGQAFGRIVVVQSTPGQRAELLDRQSDGFQVLIRGYQDGQLVDRVQRVRSISRALIADTQWDRVLEAAASRELRVIVTNATEAGYNLSVGPLEERAVPATMPGKLARVLWQRFQMGQSPLTLLPCELIERNAETLRALVCSQAREWDLPPEFETWVAERCVWLNNLVDCIVTIPSAGSLSAELQLDPLLISAEPYALLAIEGPPAGMPPFLSHPAMHVVSDLQPFYLRKVRILNGAHTAMAAKFLPAGFATVQQVLEDRDALRWVRGLVFEEIVPTLVSRVEGAAEFADTTFDRLRNPFLNHRLTDIAANQEVKIRVRLKPTFEEYQRLFGRPPRRIAEVLPPSAAGR